jgi:LCP family protein required for cell wall assembly
MNARHDGWSDNSFQRTQRTSEPPLPPELSPHRGAAAGSRGVPRQAGYGGGGGGGGYGPPRTGGGRPRVPGSRARKVKAILVGLVVVVLAVSVGTYFWADAKLHRDVDLSQVPNRPAQGDGTNYLVVGSDSRDGLTAAEKKELHTGSDSGQRTDSMMILHVGSNGNTLLSLPRDSYVTIPAFTGESGKKYPATTHKLNTAYSWGGAKLLTQTVEYNTGLRIDHYAEIGFDGFVNLVNSLGGVDMCLDKAVKDTASGADLKAGCQTLNGAQSLAFVRQRHQMADQDLGRMKNQQKFLSTLAEQAASPSTILNPFELYPVIGSGLDTLTVDKDMGLYNLGSMFFAMKGVTNGEGKSMTVPISTANYQTPSDGVAVKWDLPKAKQLFDQLKNDEKVTVTN